MQLAENKRPVTEYQRKKLKRESSVYKMYTTLMSAPGAMATKSAEVVMKKFDIASRSTVWSICNRVEARLAREAKENQVATNK